MEHWQRSWQAAAAGVVAAAVVEVVRTGGRPQWESVSRCLLAGGLAFTYAQLVPSSTWGVRSGSEFAQLPWVASLGANLGDVEPLELACWGGLAGLMLQWSR